MPDADTLSYQWYKDGIALIGETKATLQQIAEDGDYQVRVTGSSGCKITNIYNFSRPVARSFHQQFLCEGRMFQSWAFC